MAIQLTKMYAILIGALAILGIFVSGHLFQIMNTDIAIDILRIALAGALVYIGFIAKNENWARTALVAAGGMYILMAVAALISPTLGGILPSGLTGFDVAFHLVTGALAVAVGTRHIKAMTAHA